MTNATASTETKDGIPLQTGWKVGMRPPGRPLRMHPADQSFTEENGMKTSENYVGVAFGMGLTQYQTYFNDLGQDQHHPVANGGRTRRLAQYRAEFDSHTKYVSITKLRTQIFLQGPTNKLTGHVEREFDDIIIDMKPFIAMGLNAVDRNWSLADYPREWMVNLHMIRVHAQPDVHGVPVPEGLHKDGADFVIMGCVARENVKGGVSQLHESEDGPPVYGVTLMPGEAILVDDREVFHMVSPLITKDGAGYRDMLIMGLHMWSHGKYRGAWREQISEK